MTRELIAFSRPSLAMAFNYAQMGIFHLPKAREDIFVKARAYSDNSRVLCRSVLEAAIPEGANRIRENHIL